MKAECRMQNAECHIAREARGEMSRPCGIHRSSFIIHHSRSRSGITLLEVLVSIFILSVGLLGVAMLVPLGAILLRDAVKSDTTGAAAAPPCATSKCGECSIRTGGTATRSHSAHPFIIDPMRAAKITTPWSGGTNYVVGDGVLVAPAGLNQYQNIFIDASRRADAREWDRPDNSSNWTLHNTRYLPSSIDEPNDDKNDLDESLGIVDDRYFYDADGPGSINDRAIGGAHEQFVSKANFLDFLRVDFDRARPTGNKLSGSRMSDFYDWSTVVHVTANRRNGIYERADSPDNTIGLGHIDLTPPPPPAP